MSKNIERQHQVKIVVLLCQKTTIPSITTMVFPQNRSLTVVAYPCFVVAKIHITLKIQDG